MTSLKLFHLTPTSATELPPCPPPKESHIQTLIETHMPTLLGIRFLASEYSTGKKHGGRIDSLGLDENNNPVILEYKRHTNENVINQGLYYLDWLLDHKAEFEMLAIKMLNSPKLEVDWSSPRLLCIASDYTKYDSYAVEQINRNIELLRYKLYDNSTQLLLELVNSVQADRSIEAQSPASNSISPSCNQKIITEIHSALKGSFKELFEAVEQNILALGDDITKNELKYYFAYKKIKNFICLELRPVKKEISLFCKLNPDSIELEHEFTRNVRNIGHYGSGDLEISIIDPQSLTKALPLLQKCYDQN